MVQWTIVLLGKDSEVSKVLRELKAIAKKYHVRVSYHD